MLLITSVQFCWKEEREENEEAMVIDKEKSEGDRKRKVKIDTCGTLPTPVKLSWEVGL